MLLPVQRPTRPLTRLMASRLTVCCRCAEIGFSGDEAERLLKDLLQLITFPSKSWGASKLLSAIYRTASKLELHAVCEAVHKWAPVLGHYAKAMTAAYKMRPSDEDRSTFTEHARLYVLKKAMLKPGSE